MKHTTTHSFFAQTHRACGDVFWLQLWQTAGDVAGHNSATPGASVWGWLRIKHFQEAAKSQFSGQG